MSDPPSPSSPVPDLKSGPVQEALSRYWRSNVRWTLGLLAVWAVAGLGCGILAADGLNRVRLPGTGYPLGFWFAQQGSILVFVILTLVYCVVMNRLDDRHHRDLERLADGDGSDPA